MDKGERQQLKILAVDTIIANPVNSEAAILAEALEKCINELDNDSPPHCPTCSCGVSE